MKVSGHGQVFQDRYKSIVCDGDSYFTELVRYIHLNPLRMKLVRDLKELEKYPYCGHGTILGNAGKAVARLRECAGAVWEASFRGGGGVPAIYCGGSCVGAATGVSRRWTGTIGGGMVCSQITATA